MSGCHSSLGSETVVTYFFCGEEIPYRRMMKTHSLTLGHFKEQLRKKGNYRYTLISISNYRNYVWWLLILRLLKTLNLYILVLQLADPKNILARYLLMCFDTGCVGLCKTTMFTVNIHISSKYGVKTTGKREGWLHRERKNEGILTVAVWSHLVLISS